MYWFQAAASELSYECNTQSQGLLCVEFAGIYQVCD